jgi:hypothetical protein
MRIDYDLLREILLVVEDITDGHTNYTYDAIYDSLNEEPQKVWYHIKYLTDVAYIEAGNGFFIDITPIGRAYLDSVRDESVWSTVKEQITAVKSVPLDVAKTVATKAVLNLLGD